MKNQKLIMAGLAVAMITGGVATAFAQDAIPVYATHKRYHRPGTEVGAYRPLTVGGAVRPAVAPVAAPVAAGLSGIGAGLATPFNAVGAVGGPIGVGGSVIGGTISGATNVAVAPLQGLMGGPVGISANAAPPLPIKARYANTGAVETSYDEGFQQDVPVDKSGPIYQIDNTGHDRVVTPFSLVAFPATAVTSIISSPFRAGVPK